MLDPRVFLSWLCPIDNFVFGRRVLAALACPLACSLCSVTRRMVYITKTQLIYKYVHLCIHIRLQKHIYIYIYMHGGGRWKVCMPRAHGVATISRLPKFSCLFCKRALQKKWALLQKRPIFLGSLHIVAPHTPWSTRSHTCIPQLNHPRLPSCRRLDRCARPHYGVAAISRLWGGCD